MGIVIDLEERRRMLSSRAAVSFYRELTQQRVGRVKRNQHNRGTSTNGPLPRGVAVAIQPTGRIGFTPLGEIIDKLVMDLRK